MSAKENEDLALALIEALNTRDLSKWAQKLSDDYASLLTKPGLTAVRSSP
jgi:hypothetical protein